MHLSCKCQHSSPTCEKDPPNLGREPAPPVLVVPGFQSRVEYPFFGKSLLNSLCSETVSVGEMGLSAATPTRLIAVK